MKKWVWYVCVLFIISDAIYSFFQHYQFPIDGDVPSCVIPSESVNTVLEHPLGIYAIISNTRYINPNRFFSQWPMYNYLSHTPLMLQNLINPILSPFIACGLFKIFIQIVLLILLSIVTTNKNPWSKSGVVSIAIMTPFFQTHGFNEVMALIDPSITYVFFFAFPICLVLIFFMPFISKFYWQKECPDNLLWLFSMMILAVIVNLSGAINFGVCLTAVASIFIYFFINHKRVVIVDLPWRLSFLILMISTTALYSLYLNQFNSMNQEDFPSLIERYQRLPKGFLNLMTSKIGYTYLVIAVIIQYFALRYSEDTAITWRLKEFMKFILIFSGLYLILLPLGGYREYRYHLIRYDIVMPITILLILFYGMVSITMLRTIKPQYKSRYIAFIVLVMLVFTISDLPDTKNYNCQYNSIKTLVSSPQDTVQLTKDCNVLTWSSCNKPDCSWDAVTLLKKWNILSHDKLFYQK